MILQYKKQIVQVKERWYGATAEEFVRTEDGTIWKTEIYPSSCLATGDRQGVLIGDKVIE